MIEPIRLLAFAFAGADLLFEVDNTGTTLFATGATSAFSKRHNLIGEKAALLFHPGEQARFSNIVRGLKPGGRVGPEPVTLASGEKASLSMCFLPEADRISCTLVKPGKRGSLGVGIDKETGLSDMDAFVEAAAESAGGRGAMAMVNVPNLPEICTKLPAGKAADLLAGIGAKVAAMDTIAAARLSGTRFGVLTEDPHAARMLAENIQGAVHQKGLDSLTMDEVIVSLKGRNLSPEQSVLALRYVIGRFAEGKIKTTPTSDLTETFERMMEETIARAEAFNTTVSDSAFDLAYEPIVNLKTGVTGHFEALTRFEPGQSPGETIKFAEHLGLTDPFDLAVAVKTLGVLEGNASVTASIAINVSGKSIANPSAFAVLSGFFAKKRAFAKRVLIEITESAEMPDLAAADKAIQSLRKMGYRVGIDDFGAGAASLQYLHAFTVDFVKMDGAVVQRLGKSAREDALLKSVLGTCADLQIETIAEWIDSPERLQLCKDLGFQFGQGRHFGGSLAELPQVAAPAPKAARRKGMEYSWQ